MNLAIILPAAGSSSRFNENAGPLGIERRKLDEDLGGRPVLQRTVELFTKLDTLLDDDVTIGTILVAGPHDDETFSEFSFRHADKLALLGAKLIRGGPTYRYETVAAALEHVPGDATHIAVHDAARPVTDLKLIDRVIRAARTHAAVVPGVPASDTLKKLGEPLADDGPADPLDAILSAGGPSIAARPVESTLDRAGVYQIQTPQVFEVGLLRRAYAQDDLSSTDDAGLVERLGEQVVVVEGGPLNIKITRPRDLDLARAIGGFRKPDDRPSHKKF
ncbi:MAG: 2-C-methyl-D-erythritol 4-phosphate cytidylyltransferase [Planctomycetota bacterium]